MTYGSVSPVENLRPACLSGFLVHIVADNYPHQPLHRHLCGQFTAINIDLRI